MFQVSTPQWLYYLLGLLGVGLLIGLFFIFRKKFRSQRSKREVKRMLGKYELKREIRLFISYSHADSALFRIPKIAQNLEKFENIGQVLYSQKDSRDDFVKYMNKYLEESDAIILFCSETSADSEYVMDEWAAARAMGKPIIPVFIKVGNIPALLKSKMGVFYNENKFGETLKEIYGILKKRLGEPIE